MFPRALLVLVLSAAPLGLACRSEKAQSSGVAPPVSAAPTPGELLKPALVLADVPGMDLSVLSIPAQRELTTVFSDEFCYCGCPHSLGACLKRHGQCQHAQRMALLAAAEAEAGTPAVEIIVALSRYFESFGKPRSAFELDERTCRGPASAQVTLVEFSDFECPHCAAVRPMLEEFSRRSTGVRLCYMPFPLSQHASSLPAAQAVLFARDHGKFWALHDLLFENQVGLSPRAIPTLAAKVGLSSAAVTKAIDSGRYLEELEGFKRQGRAAGVDATPAVYVNGRRLALALSPVVLQHTVEDELEWLANHGAWAAD